MKHDLKIRNGEFNIPISVPDSYFKQSSLPAPKVAEIDALTLIVDIRNGRPSNSSPVEDFNTLAIHYQSYVPNVVDRYLDPKWPNYYTKYQIEDVAFGLRRRRVPFNDNLASDRQDLSFILVGIPQNDMTNKILIECRKFNDLPPELPCDMILQFNNNMVAQVKFAQRLMPKWKEVMTSVQKVSEKIGICGEQGQ